MRRVKGLVVRGPMEKVPFDVYEHEVPILQAIHGEGNIEVDEGSRYEDDAEYDATAEYERLSQRYGDNSEQGMAWVQYLYGLRSSGQLDNFWDMHGGKVSTKKVKTDTSQAPDVGDIPATNPDGSTARTGANPVLADLTGATAEAAADAAADPKAKK